MGEEKEKQQCRVAREYGFHQEWVTKERLQLSAPKIRFIGQELHRAVSDDRRELLRKLQSHVVSMTTIKDMLEELNRQTAKLIKEK